MLSLARQFAWGTGKVDRLKELLDQIVWVDINHPQILDAYAEIDNACIAAGRKLGENDAWIAATAKVSGATLLTTDRDFDPLQGAYLNRILIDESAGTSA
jgi:predicted nucleic acid-binding protein